MITPQIRPYFTRLGLVGIGAILLAVPAVHAITLTDPTLAGTIDPTGASDITVNAGSSTAKSTLEGLSGFGVIQSFTGFTGGTNQIAFTDTSRADLQLSFSGTGVNSASGSELTNAGYVTSGLSGTRLVSDNRTSAHNVIQTIDFGSWNGSTFDSTAITTTAVGFTLTGLTANFDRLGSISASFLSDSGSVLSTQSVSGTTLTGSSQSIYFGFQASGSDTIGSVVITLNINAKVASEGQVILGLDDLGFTTSSIPEPSSYAALAGLLSLGCVVFFRRK
ncbi:MAG: PEP-CTERM sorting domain-containing protein [Opitutaceae bacterium]|jgi:hypothetical protein